MNLSKGVSASRMTPLNRKIGWPKKLHAKLPPGRTKGIKVRNDLTPPVKPFHLGEDASHPMILHGEFPQGAITVSITKDQTCNELIFKLSRLKCLGKFGGTSPNIPET